MRFLATEFFCRANAIICSDNSMKTLAPNGTTRPGTPELRSLFASQREQRAVSPDGKAVWEANEQRTSSSRPGTPATATGDSPKKESPRRRRNKQRMRSPSMQGLETANEDSDGKEADAVVPFSFVARVLRLRTQDMALEFITETNGRFFAKVGFCPGFLSACVLYQFLLMYSLVRGKTLSCDTFCSAF